MNQSAAEWGYEQWAKIHNLKQAAGTTNFLTENKIEQYANLNTRIEEITAASEQAGDGLKNVGKSLSDMAVLIKNVTVYQKTKPLHEATTKALKAVQISGKFPNVPMLQTEYEMLQRQKETLYTDYGKLKKQVTEYDVNKRNIDSILQTEKQLERERWTVRS